MNEQDFIITNAGIKMPKILYGTAWKKEKTTDLVVKAVEAGFRGIDTACQPKHYAQERVGDALKILNKKGIRRDSLFIQTKFTPLAGQDPNNIPYDKNAPLLVQVAQSFARSQSDLQTQYVDSLVLHSPLFPMSHLLEVYNAMQNLHDKGLAMQLGISNCYDLSVLKRLYEESRVKPSVLQNRFYSESGYDKEIRRWCKSKGIIYQSFWSLTANPHLLESPTIVQLALKYKKTEAQILFKYLNSQEIVPLTGTASQTHMMEDLNALAIEMSPEEYDQIGKLL
ncbi:aldo/keto reductase [bacterium]|nr:aldo/keto reductase [bacterium]MBU1990223.1 aldo/keto reductase [bacterium]